MNAIAVSAAPNTGFQAAITLQKSFGPIVQLEFPQ
jgi:hypothetical protein